MTKDEINHIALFRALQLGDLLCAVPAFRALREAYPDARITLVGLPWAAGFVQRFSNYFDEFIHFPGAAGLPEQGFDEERLAVFNEEMRQRHFDLLFQMQGNGTIVNDILNTWKPGKMVGFYTDNSRVPEMLGIPYPDEGPEVHRHLQLMQSVGITPCGDQLEFPITGDDEQELQTQKLPSASYVIIHPGSRGAWRQWPVEYFAACARQCAERGFEVVITGTKQERRIVDALLAKIDSPVFDLSGRTSLGAVALLIRNANLLIANCTGVSHIASAVGTKSVIISMDGEPQRWGPLNRQRHRMVDWTTTQDPRVVYSAVDRFLEKDRVVQL